MDRDVYYRPILGDDEHLLESSETPGRYRGLSRDSNNENPDIPEWEVVKPNSSSNSDIESYAVIAAAAVNLAVILVPVVKKHVIPFIKRLPMIKIGTTNYDEVEVEKTEGLGNTTYDLETVNQIDDYFEDVVYQMSPEEAQEHMMKMMYHLLGLAAEIQAVSNSRIRMDADTEEEYFEKVEKSKRILAEKVADKLNCFLQSDTILLDEETSEELFELIGGGIRRNGEYIPVKIDGINGALNKKCLEFDNARLVS